MLLKIWSPQSCITDLKLLENVQRRATRFILSCSRDPNIRPNYKTRLIALNLLPISYWLECRDLCFAFRCINGLLNVQFDKYIQISSGRTRSSSENLNLYPIHRYRTSLFRDSDNRNVCALLQMPKTMHSNTSGLIKSLWIPLTSRFHRKFPYSTELLYTPWTREHINGNNVVQFYLFLQP